MSTTVQIEFDDYKDDGVWYCGIADVEVTSRRRPDPDKCVFQSATVCLIREGETDPFAWDVVLREQPDESLGEREAPDGLVELCESRAPDAYYGGIGWVA